MECQFRPLLAGWIQTASLGVKAAPPWLWSLRTKSGETDVCSEKGSSSGGPCWLQEPGLHWAAQGLTVCPASGTFPDLSEPSCLGLLILQSQGLSLPISSQPGISSRDSSSYNGLAGILSHFYKLHVQDFRRNFTSFLRRANGYFPLWTVSCGKDEHSGGWEIRSVLWWYLHPAEIWLSKNVTFQKLGVRDAGTNWLHFPCCNQRE